MIEIVAPPAANETIVPVMILRREFEQLRGEAFNAHRCWTTRRVEGKARAKGTCE